MVNCANKYNLVNTICTLTHVHMLVVIIVVTTYLCMYKSKALSKVINKQ